jgi:hypothetical protein
MKRPPNLPVCECVTRNLPARLSALLLNQRPGDGFDGIIASRGLIENRKANGTLASRDPSKN